MKKQLLQVLFLFVCIMLLSTVLHAMPIASDGSGHETSFSGLLDWWKKLWS